MGEQGWLEAKGDLRSRGWQLERKIIWSMIAEGTGCFIAGKAARRRGYLVEWERLEVGQLIAA